MQRLPTGGPLEEDASTTLLITADTVCHIFFVFHYCLFQLCIIDKKLHLSYLHLHKAERHYFSLPLADNVCATLFVLVPTNITLLIQLSILAHILVAI